MIGVAAVVLIALLLAALFAALSCAMALQVRSQEALTGMSKMLALPLVFLSSVLMAIELLPDWIGTVAFFNPSTGPRSPAARR
ncbi:ABC transporter permease [Egibacter rhizosphaerae]|uniref:ABC transporter permease n=1 Tax=Egibacter rhizosphaerae TaxID=1670831 RepID=UPI001F0E4B7D